MSRSCGFIPQSAAAFTTKYAGLRTLRLFVLRHPGRMGSKCLIATVMVANGRDYRRIEGIGRFKGDPAVVG
jgi:hypothetical protein